MPEKQIGVFMRVYRNEASMHKAIQSVLNQSYSNFTYYILVNHLTKETVMQYAHRDARIRVLDGKPDDGFFLYAKLVASENDYVTTIDADDWYENTYLEDLLNCLEMKRLDIVACGNYFADAYDNILSVRRQKEAAWDIQDTSRVLPHMYAFYRTIWGKMVRSAVYLDWDPTVLPQSRSYGGYGGDTMLIFSLLPFAKRAGLCGKVLYHYRMTQSGGTYMLKPGRLDADTIVFRFVKGILSELGPVDESATRFLYHVYANALRDTTALLLHRKMGENERAEKLLYIYQRDLTSDLLKRQREKRLDIPQMASSDYTAAYYEMIFSDRIAYGLSKQTARSYMKLLGILYPHLEGALTLREFMLLASREGLLQQLCLSQYQALFAELVTLLKDDAGVDVEICMRMLRRVSSVEVLKPFLREKLFITRYADILLAAERMKWEDVFRLLQGALSNDSAAHDTRTLIELWINFAAFLDNAELFIVGKEMKTELLLEASELEEARQVYDELKQLGVADENMDYLTGRMEA